MEAVATNEGNKTRQTETSAVTILNAAAHKVHSLSLTQVADAGLSLQSPLTQIKTTKPPAALLLARARKQSLIFAIKRTRARAYAASDG